MFQNIISSLANLTDKILNAALGTVSVVLVIVSSLAGKSPNLPRQSIIFDQKSLKELKILEETRSNLTQTIKINLPSVFNEPILARKNATIEATLIAQRIGVNTIDRKSTRLNSSHMS